MACDVKRTHAIQTLHVQFGGRLDGGGVFGSSLQLASLNLKVFIFAKMRICDFFYKTTANLSYDQRCSPFGDHTNICHNLQLLSLVQRLTCVHHSQATPNSYTFHVADY